MFRRAILASLMLLLSAQVTSAQSPSLFESESFGGKSKPVNLSRVVFDLTPGQRWGSLHSGLICVPRGDLKWRDGRVDVNDDTFVSVFRREMRAAGYVSGSNDLFDGEGESAGEFTVGARVKSIDADICAWSVDGGRHHSFGSATFNVDWQIYSRLQRKVVATISTNESFQIKDRLNDDIAAILLGAFGRNARAFTLSAGFREVFDSRENLAIVVTGKQAASGPISLQSSTAARPISEASGAVVLVLAGGSMGSGFLVSSDGYLITNAHVVGTEKTVRVRWSDGFESDGEVIRSNKPRDVALIKTNPHGRQPLALRRGPPTPGTNVYAVGTPLDPKLQGSLTKGIVSANRIMDGFSFIQSDVAVTHGNSGGPLLDEKSVVVGITDLSFEPDGKPANINLFIPIGDALDFLNLKTAQETAK